MAKRRETMSEGKKNIISALLDEYDIKSIVVGTYITNIMRLEQ